jgi:serine/threonine protein kinase
MKFCKACHNFFPDDIDKCLVDSTTLVEIKDTFIGKLIGGCYRILSKIADGGLSRVYCAKHMYLNREVAIKILKPQLASNEEWRKRTVREARICGSIEHRNVVRVYDMLTADGSLCIVMELLEGETLKQHMKREGRLSVEESQKIMSMTAEALARAHSLNIVHRDIKPNNIFLIDYAGIKNFVKLLDFGIAFSIGAGRMTGEGMLMGTPSYSPPEQIRGEEPTPASDIYSLGCVAYEMLTGRSPFAADELQDVIESQLNRLPESLLHVRSDAGEDMDYVVMRMLEKKPEERFSDAFDLLYTLKNLDLYRSGAEEERVEPEEMDTEEVQVLDMPTAVKWGNYFQSMESAADDDTSSQSFVRGLEAVTELSELEKRTKEIVRKMESVENRRRGYQKNIGNAIAILGMDISKTRMSREKIKMKYLKAISEREHMLQKLNFLEEQIVTMVDGRRDYSVDSVGDDELDLLSRAGRTARRLREISARTESLHRSRQQYMENLKDMKYQIIQLANSLAEVENDCSKEYERYRKMLAGIMDKGEALRKQAAQAALEVGARKS